ncbi:MAG TPA: EAL domain-containing protein, partial [Mycobacterium sp.]|nr:EAL domain-containing protein [Mycobacterium sp.]
HTGHAALGVDDLAVGRWRWRVALVEADAGRLMLTRGSTGVTAELEFDRILRDRALETVFQPIVHLGSMATVGYEALVRGPVGSSFASASSLLAAAYRTRRVVEFDWAARASASRAAVAAGLSADVLLFLNVEPLALDSPCPPDLWPDIEHAFGLFRVVLEVTERSLDRDPGSLLDGIARQRLEVEALALDDVGSTTKTLSMLPVLSADVIKLDGSVTRGGTTPAAMKILDIAYEERERTGATILAEGVETAAQAAQARMFGASLGQGHHFGQPGPLERDARDPARVPGIATQTVPDVRTPFEALGGSTIGQATADVLMPLARQVLRGGVELIDPALVIVLVPGPEVFTAADRRYLAELAERGVITGILGPGLSAEPATGARGADAHDPTLAGEWAVVALSPSSAGAMLARTVAGAGSEFEFGVTHNRTRVIAAARCLLHRLGPPPHSD